MTLNGKNIKVTLFIIMKQCSKCKQEKEICEFPTRYGKPRSNCKECARNMNNNHYLNNKQYYLDKYKKSKDNLKIKFLNYLKEKSCVDCGETDPVVLEFDHKDEKEKKYTISEMVVTYQKPWVIIEEEISKCDVRCANCHRRRTAKQFNWYRLIKDTEGV